MLNQSKKENNNAENFVVFGTAFPEQTEKDRRAGRSDAGQFVPVWKQEARDEQGRRRFHGAFTGGFSAGYFNTVGSKEGWEPTNYVSSRNDRNDRKEARPEDFMDEEDLEDMSSARRLVATEEFDILGGVGRELAARKKLQKDEEQRGSTANLIGASLIDMFGPPKDSVGVRLLRKMGWRPGQGIGPRVNKRLPLNDDESEDDEYEITQSVTFAPRDTPIENYQPKRDNYGLGFDLLASVPEVAEMKRLRELARQKSMDGAAKDKKNRASFGVFDKSSSEAVEAFGLGAFDDDEEDENIYGTDYPINNYNTTLYDDEGGYTRDELKMMQRKKEEAEKEKSTKNKIKCSDGRPPLNGFHVSTQKQHIGNWFPPPKVPADFKERHITKENETNTPASKISQDNLFSFEERGKALDEKPIEQRSVFDYMPKHSKDKLNQAVSYFIDLGKDKSQLSDFPTITKEVANLALKGFMPFSDNLKKQSRYRSYLENQAGLLSEDGIPKTVLPIPEGLTYEAGMKELDEFAQAARIFRPISSMMSGRFTSASTTSKNIEVISFQGGLQTEEEYRKAKEEKIKSIQEPEKKQLSQEAEAAAMKMFGTLTRKVKPFYPNRLVCKRFNVRNPHPDHDPTSDSAAGRTHAGSKEALSKESMESLLNKRLPIGFTSSTVETFEPSSKPNDPLLNAVIPKPSERTNESANIKAPTTGIEVAPKTNNDDDEDAGPALDYERPSMDIFKAIFDDSDSESESEEEAQPDTKQSNIVQEVDEDDFVGPPAPPQPATVDIPMTTKTSEEGLESFRPMFKRASERKQQNEPVAHIMSEEVIVQPFKSRHTANKRRHVSVSESESSESEEDDRKYSERKSKSSSSSSHKKRKSDKEHSRSSRHHDHKSSKSSHRSNHKNSSSRSEKRKRDDSKERSRRRDDSKERSRRRDDSKERSRRRDNSKERSKRKDDTSRERSRRKRSDSKERSKSSDRRHKSSSKRHEKSSNRSKKDEDDLYEHEGIWVEKEPVVTAQISQKNDRDSKKRMHASDLW